MVVFSLTCTTQCAIFTYVLAVSWYSCALFDRITYDRERAGEQNCWMIHTQRVTTKFIHTSRTDVHMRDHDAHAHQVSHESAMWTYFNVVANLRELYMLSRFLKGVRAVPSAFRSEMWDCAWCIFSFLRCVRALSSHGYCGDIGIIMQRTGFANPIVGFVLEQLCLVLKNL